MKLYVHCESMCEDSDREDGEQGAWEEHWCFSIGRASLSPNSQHNHEEFELDADLKLGDPVHLLVMRWDDGDSYGHSYGHGEVMWAFKDPLLAQEALKRWQYACDFHGDWRHDNKQQFASFRVDGGEIRKLNNPAFSYFCRVTSLRLETLIVQF